MTTEPIALEPVTLLTQLLEAVDSFNRLLTEEAELLAATPVAAGTLAAITERKGVITETLERLEAQRCQWLVAQGFTADRDGSREAARQHGFSELWQQVLEAGHQARSANRINGLSIELRLDMHQRTLGFLKAAGSAAMYGRNGRTQLSASSSTTWGQC